MNSHKSLNSALAAAAFAAVAAFLLGATGDSRGRNGQDGDLASIAIHPVAEAILPSKGIALMLSSGPLDERGEPTADGTLSRLSLSSGRVLGTTEIGVAPTSIAILPDDSRIFVTVRGQVDDRGIPVAAGDLIAVNPLTGAVLWKRPSGLWPRAVVVDPVSRRLLVVNQGDPRGHGSLSVVDAMSGRELARFSSDTYSNAASIDVTKGLVFVTNRVSNSITVVDMRNLKLVQTVIIGPEPGSLMGVSVDNRRGRVIGLSSPPHVSGGDQPTVGTVTVLDELTGVTIRSTEIDQPTGMVVDASRGLAFVLGNFTLAAYRTDDGSLVWHREFDGRSGLLDLGPNGTVVVWSSDSHRLFILSEGNGSAVCALPLPDDIAALETVKDSDDVLVLGDDPPVLYHMNASCVT